MGRPARHAGHPGRAVPDAARPGPDLSTPVPDGTRPSPNIWHHTSTYEIENRATDPQGRLAAVVRDRLAWSGREVLDLGCGTGYHLPWFAARSEHGDEAAGVTGVEPHPDLAAIARRRVRGLERVRVLQGTAQAIPLPDASVDAVHVRWAYFFGPGCEPGLAELDRVVRRGGAAVVIDNDPTRSTFGHWFSRGHPDHHPADVVERFWSSHDWTRTPVDMGWSFGSRADLEAVVGIELPPAVAEEVLAALHGLDVDYAVNVWSKEF